MFLKPYTRTAYYYETDQMAIIHHSNYIRWMEEARLDLLDQIGLNYRSIEEANLLIPVLSVSCNYQTLVHYDDTIIIEIELEQFNGLRFTLSYKIIQAHDGKIELESEYGKGTNVRVALPCLKR